MVVGGSMVRQTLLAPVTVRKVCGQSAAKFNYVLKDGCRRFNTSCTLGFTHLPCVVLSDNSSEDDQFCEL
jgi:hypothetical protein